MLTADTKRHIDSARQVLVGKVPDPKQQIDQITNALIYKFMDDMDIKAKDAGGKASFFTGDLEKYAWRKLMDPRSGSQERLNMYTEALEKFSTAAQLPQLFRDIFRQAFLPYRDPETLNLFLKEIEFFDYNHSEELGNAFEYLLSIMGSQGDAGQFRTPRHIIDFIVKVLDPDKDDTILDPACGTAGFLISAYKHIVEKHDGVDENGKKNNEKSLTHQEKQKLMSNLEGYDISSDMVKLARVNMYLHGNNDPQIYEYDSLTSEERWGDTFDIILANPPFMSPKGGIRPHNKFGVESSRAEVLFVDYIMSHLKQNGRAGIIVPEGIIFQSGKAYKQLRKNLVEDGLLAVISLPAGVFNPYAGVKTSILIFDNSRAKQSKDIIFAKIEHDGFDLGAQRRPIAHNDLPLTAEILQRYRKEPKTDIQTIKDELKKSGLFTIGLSTVGGPDIIGSPAEVDQIEIVAVSRDKIAESGDYNLTASRYLVSETSQNQKWPRSKLSDIFIEIKNGKNVKQTDEPIGHKVSRIQTIAKGIVNLDAVKWSTDDVNENDYLQKGDILFSHINSIDHLAKTALFESKEKVIHGSNLLRLRPDTSKIIPEYALYVFKSDLFTDDAKRFAQRAVNQASINSTSIKNLEIPLPPIELQKEIVAELDSYQKIIDLAKEMSQVKGMNIVVKPSWPKFELNEVASIEYGFTASAKDKGSARLVRITDIDDMGSVKKDGAKYINLTAEAEKYLLHQNDVLVARTGATYGKTAIYTDNEPAVFASFLIRLNFDVSKILPEFYWAYAQCQDYWMQARQLVQGGAQPQFNGGALKRIKIPLPSIDEQRILAKDYMELRNILVDQNRQLITIFEQKIKDKISEVWSQ